MEIELRLDADGRTTYDPGTFATRSASERVASSSSIAHENNEVLSIDYSTKAVFLPMIQEMIAVKRNIVSPYEASTNNSKSNNNISTVAESLLLYDCEVIADASEEIQIHTFWLALDDKIALEVFHHHIPSNYLYDKRNSGAEWWVQLRPKRNKKIQDANNSNQLAHENDVTENNNITITNNDDRHSIQFHWDKDEELRVLTGGAIFIHPHVSTVTYLTDKVGAPTMILPCLVDCTNGAPEFCRIDDCYYVSCPKIGKHISFDGRFLHAAPSQLLPSTETANNTRVTFLVNIWLNHRPIGVQSFPESSLHKLSTPTTVEGCIFSNCEKENVKTVDISKQQQDTTITEIQWLLGATSDSEEHIQVQVPLTDIQHELRSGGTLCFIWDSRNSIIEGICHTVTSKQLDEEDNGNVIDDDDTNNCG